mgnify:CR=1 FL=1
MAIVILTGAGLSAESGLGTFRDKGGVWERFAIEDVATPEAFAKDPRKVHAFYNTRRKQCIEAEPNAAHFALATLQATLPTHIVTQNVDDLHERAGSEAIHMHGELRQALCASCEHRWPAPDAMRIQDHCPKCKTPSTRPDIVWFGEIPYHMDRIQKLMAEASLFVSIGTSGQVYPAAGFVADANMRGIRTVELNLEPSEGASLFDETRYGPATEIVPQWVSEMLTATQVVN